MAIRCNKYIYLLEDADISKVGSIDFSAFLLACSCLIPSLSLSLALSARDEYSSDRL